MFSQASMSRTRGKDTNTTKIKISLSQIAKAQDQINDHSLNGNLSISRRRSKAGRKDASEKATRSLVHQISPEGITNFRVPDSSEVLATKSNLPSNEGIMRIGSISHELQMANSSQSVDQNAQSISNRVNDSTDIGTPRKKFTIKSQIETEPDKVVCPSVNPESLESFIESKANFTLKKPGEGDFSQFPPLDLQFPIVVGSTSSQISAQKTDFIYDMEIVDNFNKVEKIKVSHPPSGRAPQIDEIPNPMMKEDRDRFFRELSFVTEYRSGYEPIKMQQLQEQAFNFKNHFIKKKQSCQNVNIKRCSGVSYVKKTESEQINVGHIFQKLPHLVIQGSISCEVQEDKKDFLRQVYEKILCNESDSFSLLLSWFEAEDENLIREYLLYPTKRFEIAKGR